MVMAYTVMIYIVMAYIVMVYVVMAYLVMAYLVMAYVVMAYIAYRSRYAQSSPSLNALQSHPFWSHFQPSGGGARRLGAAVTHPGNLWPIKLWQI